MQYKTVSMYHSLGVVKNNKELEQEVKSYESLMNKMASEGWKLLGIHTVPYYVPAGCMDRLFKNAGPSIHNLDILIFFRD